MNGNEQFTRFFAPQYECDNNTFTNTKKHIQTNAKSNASKNYCQRTPLQSKLNKPLNDLINNSSLSKKHEYTLLMKRKMFNASDDNNSKIINEKDELIKDEKENDERNYNRNKKCNCDNCHRMFRDNQCGTDNGNMCVPKYAMDFEELTQMVDNNHDIVDVCGNNGEGKNDDEQVETCKFYTSADLEVLAKFNETNNVGLQINLDIDD